MNTVPTLEDIIFACGFASEKPVDRPDVHPATTWLREAGFSVADNWDGMIQTRLGRIHFSVDSDNDLRVLLNGAYHYTGTKTVTHVLRGVMAVLSDGGIEE